MGCSSSKYADPEQPTGPALTVSDEPQEASAEEELIALKMIADAEKASFEELEGLNDDIESESPPEPAQTEADEVSRKEAEDAAEKKRLEEDAARSKAEKEAADAARAAVEAENARMHEELAKARAETEAIKAEAELAKAAAEAKKAETERAVAAKAAAEAGADAAHEEKTKLAEEAERVQAEKDAAKAAADAAIAKAEAAVAAAQAEARAIAEQAEKARADAEAATKAREQLEKEKLEAEANAAKAKQEAANAVLAREKAEAQLADATLLASRQTTVTTSAGSPTHEPDTLEDKNQLDDVSKKMEILSSSAGAATPSPDQVEQPKALSPVVEEAGSPKPNHKPPSPKAKFGKLSVSDAERTEQKEEGNSRMFKEMQSMKRRENSFVNRKKAAAFAMGVAQDKNVSFNGGGIKLGTGKASPLLVRKSIKAAKRPDKKTQFASANVSGSAKQLMAELDKEAANVSASEKTKLAPSTSTGAGVHGTKKSIKKSIRNIFKSVRKVKSKSSGGNDAAPLTAPASLKRKPGAVTVAEIDAGLPPGDEYEKLDQRAIEAARWTDKVVVQLISEIKLRGEKNAAGQYCITFGKLFEETANIFDALVGIIKTAKKYHVVHANKDQLWQGQDDAEVITLLKETHSGVLINRRHKTQVGGGTPAKTKGFGATSLANQNQKCAVCNKTVYPMEFVGASDKAFHKNCFRCKTCKCVLKPNDYCNVKDEFYCPTHYKELINLAGGAGNEAL